MAVISILAGSKNNNGGRVRDTEIPFELKIATRSLEPGTLTQNTAAAIRDQAEAADQHMASYISESIKNEEMASGAEYSADDLTAIINERFPGINANILNLAIKMIMIDSPDVKSRVAGTFPSFKLLVSARKPAFSKQTTTPTSQQQTIPAAPKVQAVPKQQQNQQQPDQLNQKNASVDVKNKSWVELRHMILQRPIS